MLRAMIRSAFRWVGYDLVRTTSLAAEWARLRNLETAQSDRIEWQETPVPDDELPRIDLARQHELARQLHLAQLANHYVLMDIVGTCNLRCPSCAVGNSEASRSKGVMKLETFRKILDKLKTDRPDCRKFHIDLFNWGEPALHTDLPAFIRLLNEYGMNSGISSNLNVFPRMKEVISESPSYIRVSLSGYRNETYQRTHRGGNVHAVMANLYRLREYIDSYKASTIVQVGFHIYRSNFPFDFLRIRELCDDLGFLFAPVLASFMPAEKVLDIACGQVDPSDRAVLDNFVVPIEQQLEYRRQSLPRSTDCALLRRTTLGFDGAVWLCCAVYGQDKVLAPNYLDVTWTELAQRKSEHSFCTDCTAHHVDQIYNHVEPEVLHEEAARVLGPLYAAYRRQTQHLGQPDYVILDDQFLHRDAAYKRLLAALSLGDEGRSAAEKYAAALVRGAPEFGEGYFQAARLAAARGDHAKGLALLQQAVKMTPEHAGYRAELDEVLGKSPATFNRGIPLPMVETVGT